MKEEKGITLISLVVTIIILIILAGVSINLVLGENGIINKAKYAKENYLLSANTEIDKLENIIINSEKQITTENYGDSVNYIANGVSDWKIFYKDKNTNEIFIISSDYIPIEKIPSNIGMVTEGKYQAYFNTEPSDYTLINNDIRNKFMFYWNKSIENSNIKCISKLLDINIWNGFANGMSGTKTIKGTYAIGSPTLEMWVSSWNNKYKDDILSCNTSNDNGYYLNIGTDSGTNININYDIMSTKEGYNNPLYYPHKSNYDGCNGYWIASPSAYEARDLIYVYCNGSISNSYYVNSDFGIRPVVSLPSTTNFTWNDLTQKWDINY